MTWTRLRDPILALAGTLLVGVVLLVATGHDPALVGRELADRVLLRRAGVEESIVAATPILIAALSAWAAARVGLWNIGIDGQIVAGAIAAGAVAPLLDDLPRVAMWLVVTAAGMLTGAGWALLPALLRARSGINEIVTTIMMTYVAFAAASWLVKGPLKDDAMVAPATVTIDVVRRIPRIVDSRVHVGVIAVVALAIVAWVVARWTVPGILSRVVGEAPASARTLAIPARRYLVGGFLLSGAIAALAGVGEVLVARGAVQADWRPVLTLPAFAALFLASRHPGALMITSLLLGMLAYASTVLPRSTGLAPDFFPMLEGVLLVFLAVGAWQRLAPARAPVDDAAPEALR